MGKKLILAALALTGALGTGLAQARDVDVQWSVTIGSPGGAVYGQPVYGGPGYGGPVYSQPYPVVETRPYVVTRPAPVIVRSPRYVRETRWDRDGDGIPNRYD